MILMRKLMQKPQLIINDFVLNDQLSYKEKRWFIRETGSEFGKELIEDEGFVWYSAT